MERRKMWTETMTLALGIAVLPPLWAVAAPYIGVTTGAVALICACLFVTNGNKYKDAFKICIGFLCRGSLGSSSFGNYGQPELESRFRTIYDTVCNGRTGGSCGYMVKKMVFLPAWLCGWAIGLTIMASAAMDEIGSFAIQIGVAMVVGVVYVGIGVDLFQSALIRMITGEKRKKGAD